MRKAVAVAVIALVGLVLTAAGGAAAAKPGSGAFSGFNGKVSCHWVRSSTVTTVRCWGLERPGSNNAVSTGDTSGRIARTQWHPPVGRAMVFGHKYNLGNGVTCAYRWHHPTDTTIIKSVECATSVAGPLIFARPEGVSANLSP